MSDTPLSDPTSALLTSAGLLAGQIQAVAVLVLARHLPEGDWVPGPELEGRLLIGCQSEAQIERLRAAGHERLVRIPPATLSRMGQVKVTILLAVTDGLLRAGQRVVCLAGAGQGLDLMYVAQVGASLALAHLSGEQTSASGVHPRVLGRLLELAVELGSEGREGRPVGTLFVVGDYERVKPLTRQMILNPFFGYPEADRNLLEGRLAETIKELATIDGAFLIRGDGVVESAGTFLKTSALPDKTLPSGLGARHQAAAGITCVTDCLAITVSESTGTVCVFRGGEIVTELHQAQVEVRSKI